MVFFFPEQEYMDIKSVSLKKFDMSKLKEDSVVVLLGKRRSGKSILVKDILYHKRNKVQIGSVISNTDHLSKFYEKFIPKILIHNKYKGGIIKNMIKRQIKASNENWKNGNAFLLMDDCLSDSRVWKRDENIKEIFFNGRWYNFLFILTMQAPMGITPELRTNVDYTFIFKNNNARDRETIFKNYAGVFPDFKTFSKILDGCTEDYHVLVIDNTTDSNKLHDQVFFYKASFHEDFKMCSKKIWEQSDIINRAEENKKSDPSYRVF